VLHRDIKPDNIMLGPFGETLVLDWGLAKSMSSAADPDALEAPLAEAPSGGSSETRPGSRIGTPRYMSPEQAAGQHDRMGPASDVYSLGATLYTILTGQQPFAQETDVEVVLAKVQSGDFPPPRSLAHDIPRPLEAICLKAMSKLPEERYASAMALAEDIDHWLADEPVAAWPEPFRVRARRWARRNRTAMAGGVATLMVGLVGLGAVAAVQVRANGRLRDANVAIREALAQSEESRKQAEAVGKFLVDAFRSPDPSEDGRLVKVADVLDRAAEKLDKEFDGSQATKGALLNALGQTYFGLGLFDKARSLHSKARVVRETALGPDHADTLESRTNLASANLQGGRTAEAIKLHEETLKLKEAKFGPEHPDTLVTRNNLANAYSAAGRTADALALHETTLKLRQTKLGPSHRDTLLTGNNLATDYYNAGRTAEAIELLDATLKLQRAKLGPDHPDTLNTLSNLAACYRAAGRIPESIALSEEALELREAKLGREHPGTLVSRDNLAVAYAEAGRIDDAIRLHTEVLKLREAKLGRNHPHTLQSRNNLAAAYQAVGRTAEAITLHEATLKRRESTLGLDHHDTLLSRNNLAAAYAAAGRNAEAITLHEATFKMMESKLGADHPYTLLSMSNLADTYRAAGRFAEAIALHKATLKLIETKFGPDHPNTLAARGDLAAAHDAAGQFPRSEPLLREGVDRARKQFGFADARTAGAIAQLGLNLIQRHKWTDAEPILRECLTVREKAQPDVWSTFNARSLLGGSLLGQGRLVEAEPLIVSGFEGMNVREAKIPAPGKARLSEAADRVVRLYEAWRKPDKVREWRAKLGLDASDLPLEVFAR